MQVVSVNVGLPREVVWRGEAVSTGIFKEPVEGAVLATGVNLEGDGQADLTVHGGRDKAVYVYPAEHYAYWEKELGRALGWGAFGENLTVEGMPLETEIGVGDRLGVGSAELVVTQPRLPCFKLGIRFGDPGMVRRFFQAERTGYYLRIAKEGCVEAGDDISVLEHHPAGIAVSEITQLFTRDEAEIGTLRRLLTIDPLPEEWRTFIAQLVAAESDGASHG